MRVNKLKTLKFRVTQQQQAMLQPQSRIKSADGSLQADAPENSFRAWNAAFVDCQEPIPD
jgi:hypothetical protein